MQSANQLTVSPLFAAAVRIPVGALPTDIHFALILCIYYLSLSIVFEDL